MGAAFPVLSDVQRIKSAVRHGRSFAKGLPPGSLGAVGLRAGMGPGLCLRTEMTVLPWRQREPKCVLAELKSLTPGKTRGARHSTVMWPGKGTPYSTPGLSSEKRGGGLCLITRRRSQAGSA